MRLYHNAWSNCRKNWDARDVQMVDEAIEDRGPSYAMAYSGLLAKSLLEKGIIEGRSPKSVKWKIRERAQRRMNDELL